MMDPRPNPISHFFAFAYLNSIELKKKRFFNTQTKFRLLMDKIGTFTFHLFPITDRTNPDVAASL